MEAIYLGNQELLKLPKTAFLCSSNIAAEAVMKCYDWAARQVENGSCVISGFHSALEKDVLHFLLRGKQPIIMVLGRRMYKKIPEELAAPLNEGRLLIVSPVSQKTERHSRQTVMARNKYIIQHADHIVFGYIHELSSLFPLYQNAKDNHKNITIL
jgi:predicted Rossmann fold nucleotide-binding protein DprA/Smf involved in DNA uptake